MSFGSQRPGFYPGLRGYNKLSLFFFFMFERWFHSNLFQNHLNQPTPYFQILKMNVFVVLAGSSYPVMHFDVIWWKLPHNLRLIISCTPDWAMLKTKFIVSVQIFRATIFITFIFSILMEGCFNCTYFKI